MCTICNALPAMCRGTLYFGSVNPTHICSIIVCLQKKFVDTKMCSTCKTQKQSGLAKTCNLSKQVNYSNWYPATFRLAIKYVICRQHSPVNSLETGQNRNRLPVKNTM